MIQGAVAVEVSVGFRERVAFGVFGDDDSIWREDGAACTAEEVEGEFVFFGCFVGWVEVDEVDFPALCGEAFEGDGGRGGFKRVVAVNFQQREIGADGFERGRGVLDEDGLGGAAAEGLDADGSRTCVEVEKNAAGDARGEDIEEGFAEAVAGWPGVMAGRRRERPGSELSGDDAHDFMLSRWRFWRGRRGDLRFESDAEVFCTRDGRATSYNTDE